MGLCFYSLLMVSFEGLELVFCLANFFGQLFDTSVDFMDVLSRAISGGKAVRSRSAAFNPS